MILFPQAKINLGLNVHFKRNDGYHELTTCMIPIPLYDVLEVLPAEDFEFQSSGIEIVGNPSDNLCSKAFQLMASHYTIPKVKMHLRKQIPMGAGLGGGSSDAASVLLALNQMFDLKCSDKELAVLAAQLGSDCPFFIRNKPQIGKGRGELLTDVNLDLKGKWLYLLNPAIHVSTQEAYAGIILGQNQTQTIEEIITGDIYSWKSNLKNDFEPSVFSKYPELKEIKMTFYESGAIYAAMSGSGSTLFGIFEEKPTLLFVDKDYSQWILPL